MATSLEDCHSLLPEGCIAVFSGRWKSHELASFMVSILVCVLFPVETGLTRGYKSLILYLRFASGFA